MKEKQQQLLFDKGITNVPSDALCSDNALEESLGMVYENGEHRVIQKPKEKTIANVQGELVYIHQDRYIFNDNGDLIYRIEDSETEPDPDDVCSLSSGEELKGITSIGKTLVVATSKGLKYVLWDNGYKLMGDSIPEIPVRFSLGDTEPKAVSYYNDRYVDVTPMVGWERVDFPVSDVLGKTIPSFFWVQDKEEDGRSAVIGLVAKRLKRVKEDKEFAFPFWVRYATRLYDGSYTHISNPVLMMPTAKHNCNVFFCMYGENEPDAGKIDNLYKNSSPGNVQTINYLPESAVLNFTVSGTVPSGWTDIIKGIDVFVSREVRGFDIDGRWEIINPDVRAQGSTLPEKHNQVLVDGCWGSTPKFREKAMDNTPETGQSNSDYLAESDSAFGAYISPSHYSESEVIQELLDNSIFYKLFELDAQNLPSGETDSRPYIRKGTLENLETQEQLEADDYFSYSSMSAEIVKAYNSRLHLADIKRGFFAGFDQFSYTAYDDGLTQTHPIDVYVYIKSENGEDIVEKYYADWQEIIDIWYYYPDPRAYRVEFYKHGEESSNFVLSLPLTEHPHLHGAYYFNRLPYSPEGQFPAGTTKTPPTANNNAVEELPNTLAVSEVNNPFLFLASGYHEVGMGKITGLAVQTAALGQEEHGKHPLLVFMNKGIWTMMVDDVGLYIRSDAFSREVSVNQKAITETDGAIFFASEKGLMLIVGSAVKCVSEQLSGKMSDPFADYLKTAFIAYDYRDSLLWIFDGASHTENNVTTVGSSKCWVYSIKSGTFGRYDFGTRTESNVVVPNTITNVVNDYPDYLLQYDSIVLSLIKRPNINLDGTTSGNTFTPNTYTTKIKTRPMKLENALALKSIMQIKHIHDIENLNVGGANDPALTFNMYGSNNLKNWVQLQSLRGTPWKYYRFEYDFTKLKATDRFSGTMLVTQERRTDKLR